MRSRGSGCGTSSPGRPTCRRCSPQIPERAGLTGRRLRRGLWGKGFAGILAPALAAATLELARDWRPDLVVHEDSEQGSWIAAERLGIPHVALQATAWRGTGLRLSSEPLNGLRASLGLPADPALERWHRHGYLGTRPAVAPQPGRPAAADHGPDPAGRAGRHRGLGTVVGGRAPEPAGVGSS